MVYVDIICVTSFRRHFSFVVHYMRFGPGFDCKKCILLQLHRFVYIYSIYTFDEGVLFCYFFVFSAVLHRVCSEALFLYWFDNLHFEANLLINLDNE